MESAKAEWTSPDHCKDHNDGKTWVAWEKSDSLPGESDITTSQYWYLTANVTLTGNWVVPSGEVHICLNGKTISLAEAAAANNSVIAVSEGAKLTICDCDGSGKITGSTNANGGGGVLVDGSASVFTLEGGNICDNTAPNGAVVQVQNGASFVMNGGSISNNTASNMGGGVCIANSEAVFTMTGGSIKSNKATKYGGGIYSQGTVTISDGTIEANNAQWGAGIANCGENNAIFMTGGLIKDNETKLNTGAGKCCGGGIYNENSVNPVKISGGTITGNYAEWGAGIHNGQLTVGGTAVITGNMTSKEDETPNNVRFGNYYSDYYAQPDDEYPPRMIILGTKTETNEGNGVWVPEASMRIGVTLENPLIYEKYDTYTDWPIVRENVSTVTASNFISDDPQCGVEIKNGMVYVAYSIYDLGDGSFAYSYDEAEGMLDEVILSDIDDVTFDGWYTKRTGGELVSRDGENFEAPYTGFAKGPNYYAHWKYKDKPVVTEPIYVFPDKVLLSGEAYTNEMLAPYNLSFDTASSTLTADGTVMMVNVTRMNYPYLYEDYPYLYEDSWTSINAAVNVAPPDAEGTAGFVMKGDTYIAYCGINQSAQHSTYGGGVYVGDGGSFIMESGTMNDNISWDDSNEMGAGGGVYLDEGASAEMKGGTISTDLPLESLKPTAMYGGGVYVSADALFKMSGGTIENQLSLYGGGVYVANYGSFAMTGGTIKNNIAEYSGAGIEMNKYAYVSVSGGQIINNGLDLEDLGEEGILPFYGGGGIRWESESMEDYSCLTEGTMITMADGSHKPIEELKRGDEVLAFDHETGETVTTKVHVVYEYDDLKRGAFTLHFTGDNDVSVVGGHLFYEQESNGYVLIENLNAKQFIGHHFYNLDDGCWETLEGVSYIAEPVRTLFIATENQINCITDGMLSNEDGFYGILCRIFEYDEDMKYDAAKKAADIEKYGLWGFENSEFTSKEIYDALKLQYMNVAIGKGLITLEELKAQGAYYSTRRNELKFSADNAAQQGALKSVSSARSLKAAPESGLILGGDAVITDNIGGNVFIFEGNPITIGDGENGCAAPKNGMKVNVYLATEEEDSIGQFTSNGTADDVKYFAPDPYFANSVNTKFVTDHLEFSNECTVSFDLKDYGEAIDDIIVEKGSTISELPAPEDDAATFVGWYKDSACSDSWDIENDTVEEDIVLFAKWNKKAPDIPYIPDIPGPSPVITPEPTPEPAPVPTPVITPEPTSAQESTTELTIPVENEGVVRISAEVTGGEVVLNPVTENMLENITGSKDSENATEMITIDVTEAGDKVEGITLTKGTADALAGAIGDEENTPKGIEFKLAGRTMTFDAGAMNALSKAAQGDNIRIVVAETDSKTLSKAQQQTVKYLKPVATFEAYVESNGVRIHDFKGGTIQISIPVEMTAGKDPKYYHVEHLKEDGTTERMATAVSGKNAIMVTAHCSDYIVVYDESVENETAKYEAGKMLKPFEASPEQLAAELNSGLLVSQKDDSLVVNWGQVTGADGYVVYGNYCGSKAVRIKRIKSADTDSLKITKLNGKALDMKKNFKFYVVAYKLVDGKRVRIAKSVIAHIVGNENTKYTNTGAIVLDKSSYVLKKGKSTAINAASVLDDPSKKPLSNAHAAEFRFATDNAEVAVVSKKGKITAVNKGACSIYIYARNGFAVKIDVIVK